VTYYLGSKAKHAAELIAITCANRKQGTCYLEPFVGGGNVICRVPPEQGPRIGSDVNWRMIELLDAVGNRGWLPPETMTEEEYDKIRTDPDAYPPELAAFAATAMSFGGKWFGGYAKSWFENGSCIKRDSQKEQVLYNHAKAGKNAILRDAPGLRDVKFLSLRYEELTPHILPESIVYCDPPYAGTQGYGGAKTDIKIGEDLSLNTWNCGAFWKWADALVDEGHQVFVSEYKGPPSYIYDGKTELLKTEQAVCLQLGKKLDADPKSPAGAREALRKQLADLDKRIKAERERLAARWMTMWEKEVVSSFDSDRGTEAKKEVEKLFHRKP
jgi:DNA adenine methylase